MTHFKLSNLKFLPLLALSVVTHTTFAQSSVEKCATNFGTVSVIEAPQGYGYLSSYGLGSPSALLRLMIQQSGCFDVVERGRALSSLQQERALAGSGDLQGDSNVGKGQMQAADFVMTPDIQVTGNTGGVGAAVAGLGRLFGSAGAAIGGLVGGVKFKEAQTSLLISDVRSGIQVAAAEGKAKKTDFSIGGWGYGGGAWGGGGGYTNTPEGKMISASLLDNFNQIVIQIRDKSQLIRPRSASSAANAAGSIQATGTSAPAPVQQFAPIAAPQAMPTRNAQQPRSSHISSGMDDHRDAVPHAASMSGATTASMMLSIGLKDKMIHGLMSGPDIGSSPLSGSISDAGLMSLAAATPQGVYVLSGNYDFATQKFSGTWTGPKGTGVFSGNKF